MTLAGEAGWPRATLDADYTARDCVTAAEFARIIGDYSRLTDAARSMAGVQLDLSYGEGLTLDLYGAAPDRPRPVFVFLHGGYWRALSKGASGFMAPMLAAQGIACAVPDYTLAPAASLTEITRQCRAAVASLWRNAPALGIDRSRIVVGGSSAGGHLAAMLALGGWQAGFGLPPDAIRAALPVSGLYDLAPIAACHPQDWLHLTRAEVAALSPIRHPPETRIVPACASTETPGFHRQSEAYAHATRAPLLTIAGRNHFDVILDLTDPDTVLSRTLLSFY